MLNIEQNCDFGCGNKAVIQFKNGRNSCSKFTSKCPTIRQKNFEAHKGKNPFEGKEHPRGNLGRISPSKGKTYIELFGVEGAKLRIQKTKENRPYRCGRLPDPEKEALRKKRISETMKGRTGGYRQGSGRGKKGWYRGFFCDSSYELAYVLYCLDHGISIKRNTEKRKYTWKGKVKNYIPDFIVEGKLVEIKGYNCEEWQAKMASNTDIKVLYEKDLKDVFTYVIEKHGKDFIKMYE